jgi:SAM-dependent methyltransferase
LAPGSARRTSERHSPDHVASDEERGLDVRHRYAYDLVRDYAEPSHRLLDVGSGEGYGSTILMPFVASYAGIDVSADAVAKANERYGSDNVVFQEYDGLTIPHPNGSFDLITSYQVIEHVADVPRYVAEMRRVGRPGGYVLVTTPNRKLRLAEGERPWNRYHLREYDAEGLREILTVAFDDVAIYGIRGSEEMERLERRRLARARRYAKLDRFGLRHRLPETVDARIRRLLRRHRETTSVQPDTLSLAAMWRSGDNLDMSLDLLAVARV